MQLERFERCEVNEVHRDLVERVMADMNFRSFSRFSAIRQGSASSMRCTKRRSASATSRRC